MRSFASMMLLGGHLSEPVTVGDRTATKGLTTLVEHLNKAFGHTGHSAASLYAVPAPCGTAPAVSPGCGVALDVESPRFSTTA